MKLIKKGAEGDLFLTVWNKQKAVLKARKEKNYRNSQLDNRIRKQRTIRESAIISEVKSFGISTPLVYFVDTKNCTILMQYIRGTLIHDLPKSKLTLICKKIGQIVGTMHKNGIMHGDLTTTNFILSHGKIFVIDFGLAIRTKKPEDHAVDLRLFKEILNSAHVSVMKNAWKNFLQGYKTAVGISRFNKVTNLVSVIESRGRYATVV
ncbi:MAG: Mn2+-dependent serine/threonine protein kinase [Nitrosopumilales archaeon]|nr:MAG: Mn2+-dependent serine/threonine protein kinase [Nitrosopumilales archaeon]